MKSKITYHEQTDMENTLKLREVLKTLPSFTSEFFRGISTTTSTSTRIKYAYDLRIFFQYLQKENPELAKIPMDQMSVDVLDQVTALDLEEYTEYLKAYIGSQESYARGCGVPRRASRPSGRRSPPSPETRRFWSSAENSITGWASGVRRSTTSTRRCVSTTRMSKPRSSPGWCRRYWNSDTKIYTTPEMTRLKIALLAGGDSPEREIALQSAAQIEAALDHSKYDITVIDLHGRDWHHTAPDGRQWQVDKNDFSITVDGVRKAFDYALIIIHGTPGEDGKLQGYLDMMGVPYSSCSMTSSVITFDKITAKRTLAGRVNLAREVFLRRGEAFDPAQIVAELGMPLFVKPNANGSSFGVTKVHAPEELPAAIEAAFAQGDEILIEECVTGREMGCGMLVAGGREYVFPITEIVSKKDFFDYEAKYTAGFSDEITPADITPEVKAELN